MTLSYFDKPKIMISQEHFLQADYLKTSEDAVVAENPTIYLDGFARNKRIVIKNKEGDVVLIIPKNAISQTIRREPTKIDFYTDITPGRQRHYKIGFSTSSKASTWNDLLNKLGELGSDTLRES